MPKRIMIFLTLAFASLGIYQYVNEGTSVSSDEIRETLLSYATDGKFADEEFFARVNGGVPVEIQRYYIDTKEIYASLPYATYSKETMAKLAIDPSKIAYGQTASGKFVVEAGSNEALRLDNLAYRGEDEVFFRIDASNWRFDPEQELSYPFGENTYTVAPMELNDFISNHTIWGGKLNAIVNNPAQDGVAVTISNHGAFVARKETSLTRLVEVVTKGATNKEAQIQAVLDFVSTDITYNQIEANLDSGETLKRPNEVLMTGTSDCSGHAILLASMLEQLDVDYQLLYIMPKEGAGHITVLVAGNFPNDNRLKLSYEGKDYFVAESTAQGFQIGVTRLQKPLAQSREDLFLQRPGEDAPIIRFLTGEPLQFF